MATANALNLPYPTPINKGGTNSSSQTNDGIAYYDGSAITTNSSLNFNGSVITLSSATLSTAIIITSSGSGNTEQIFFNNAVGLQWTLGQINSDGTFRLIAPLGGTPISFSPVGAITLGNLSVSTILSLDASKNIITTALSGDVTSSGLTTTISANVVSNAKLRQSSALSVVGNSTNATANVADIAAASDFQVLRRSGTAIGFGAINLASASAVTGVLPNANTTATSANTTSAIVARDSSGDFSAATITALGNVVISTNGSTLNLPSADADKILFLNSTYQAKIEHSNGWNLNFYSGSIIIGGASGVFNWYTNPNTGGFVNQMTLGNTGDLNLKTGNLLISTVGKTMSLKSGANGSTGSATLSGGTVTVSSTAVSTGDVIDTMITAASNPGLLRIVVSNGVGFTATSANGSDASTITWKRTAVA